MKGVLVERERQKDTAGSYRSRALEEAIEVEHLRRVLVERELWEIQQEAIEVEHLKKL